jgi:hypothetical protein
VFKKNICDGVGGQDELNGITLYPPLFWLDNIFNMQLSFERKKQIVLAGRSKHLVFFQNRKKIKIFNE